MSEFKFLLVILIFSVSIMPGPFEDEIRASLSFDSHLSDINPRFVPLIMTRDPYRGCESDGEEDESLTYDFEELGLKVHGGQWDEMPFYLDTDTPGKLRSMRSGRPTKSIWKMAEQFSTESFGVSVEESQSQSRERVALNVIANRLSSISRSMNYKKSGCPPKSLICRKSDTVPVCSSYYHIVPTWKERITEKGGARKNIVAKQERVAKFFRTWKAWEQAQGIDIQSDMSAARQFRRYYETGFGSIVPFQSFRNALLDHKATKAFVQRFYKKGIDPVYLLYFDDDFASLRPFKVGLLSIYEHFIRYKYSQTRQLPTHLSSGYRFATEADISIVASEIDRWVRASTAYIFSPAVCYPEPNLAVLAKNPALERRILRSRFDESKVGKSNTESRDFIKDALRVGDATLETIHFLPYGPLPTETPERVAKKSREVNAGRDERGRIKCWDKSALTFLRTMPQSHLESRDWAQGVVAALTLNDVIKPDAFEGVSDDFKGERGRTIHNIAMSAICKMFSAYSPVAPHVLKSIEGVTPVQYAKNYGLFLLDYDRQVPCLIEDGHKGGSLYADYLGAVRNTTSIERLRCILEALCSGGKEDAEKIEQAAKLSGRIVKDALMYYYDFPGIEEMEEARQATIMYELDQQIPSLIALDATTPCPRRTSVDRDCAITLAKTLSPTPKDPNIHAIGAMIKALKLPKNKRYAKATNKKIVKVFGLHNSGSASVNTIASYVTKIPVDLAAKYTPAIEKIAVALWVQSQQVFFKDFAKECGYTWKDVLAIVAASPGKLNALSEFGLDSLSILNGNLTVFELFQILELIN